MKKLNLKFFFSIRNFHGSRILNVKNYYKVLEVSSKATDSQVKQAFLKLAKVYHPDVNKAPGTKEKFAEILEAYDILSDESKREIYDKSGLSAAQQEDMEYEDSLNKLDRGEYDREIEISSDEDQVIDHQDKNLNELIDRINKLGPNNKGIQSIYDGSDQNEHSFPIVEEINISFAEYVKGCNKNIFYRKIIICPDCKGEYCQKCMYLGFKSVESTEQIQIPSGFEFKGDYFVYKLKNKGNEFFYKKFKLNRKLKKYEEIKSLEISDLIIKVKVNDHDYFKREGNNIITENYISISQYILGGKLSIGTIHGEKEINIIAYEDQVFIKNYGVNSNGDHIVKLNIKLPKEITKEQFKIYTEIQKYDI